MNASCALQHFCDTHGPQILLCTEGRPYTHDRNDNDNEILKTIYSQYIKSDNSQGKVACKSCTVSSDGIVVTTVDLLNHMQYITSPSTPNQELFKNIRNACVRSLNVEKSMENDHPVLFGDDENGYCLSLSFPCKDFYARGSQRLYSLCFLCRDKYYLLSLMNRINNCMKQAIHWLQYDANQTYENEGHIKVNTTFNETTKVISVCRPPPRMPALRMISDIVQDSNLIYRVHALFVWILRTANSAINELHFDGLATEDLTTKFERQNAFENDHIVKQRTGTLVDSNNLTTNEIIDYDEDDFDSLEYHFSSYGFEALKLFKMFIQKLNNINYLEYILYNWIIGNQLIIKYTNKTNNKDYIRAFASVFRLFLPDNCCHLIETTDHIASCTANLILFDMNSTETTNKINENLDNNSIIIKITFDVTGEQIQEAELETLPLLQSNTYIPTYVKTIIEILIDYTIDNEALEAMITQQKIKYLNKAKLYFQLGRCQIASTLSLDERKQMEILNIRDPNDLLIIRFWQRGISQSYKTQIRLLKQDDNQQQKVQKS
ncbi:unnamed protein product [Adineta steineri]|uniref:Folliculin n=2 Tax=Adineta steineri TaxID=433720 RepID=A0A819CA28_9BILA|nr:unnamed protein product [Adineta steineri]CAF3815501.1 unnamed protein product [Adineta steineri]